VDFGEALGILIACFLKLLQELESPASPDEGFVRFQSGLGVGLLQEMKDGGHDDVGLDGEEVAGIAKEGLGVFGPVCWGVASPNELEYRLHGYLQFGIGRLHTPWEFVFPDVEVEGGVGCPVATQQGEVLAEDVGWHHDRARVVGWGEAEGGQDFR